MSSITLFIGGIAKPAGSKRGFIRGKHVVMVDMSGEKGKDWRGDVKHAGKAAYSGPLLDEPLYLEVLFTFTRPKSHYYTGKRSHVLRENAPKWKRSMPDATKLLRSVEDGLTSILWVDDACICEQKVIKRYCVGDEKPGALVYVETLEARYA